MPLSSRLYKTEAIILRQRRFADADRFLTLYSPTLGKFDVKARGVRRTTSRMSGHLQPLTRCMLQLAQGHAGDVVTGCETMESFPRLREDLDRLSRGMYAAELIDRFVPEHVPGYVTYRLLLDTLRRLEESDSQDTVLRFAEMRLLDQTGFRPQLDTCVGCGAQLQPEQNFFAPQSGGAICRACTGEAAGARTMSLNALKTLRLLQRGSYNDIARVKVPEDLAVEVERHLRSYIVCVLERDVNAAGFLERLRREDTRRVIEV
jgi:DNA repair protein RecO (recombination protein O)